jgi:hypothetical protein
MSWNITKSRVAFDTFSGERGLHSLRFLHIINITKSRIAFDTVFRRSGLHSLRFLHIFYKVASVGLFSLGFPNHFQGGERGSEFEDPSKFDSV